MNYKTIIEPFKIKVVEPIKITTVEERKAFLKKLTIIPSY
jgi:tryptophanase